MTAPHTPPYRVLIVDDEPAARRGVVQLLEYEDAFEVIGECATGEEMVAAVRRDDPDLIFLDVEMPGLDGFGGLAGLPPTAAPLLIFVTGYDRYAVRAFEAHAIDYVLKPYTPERFRSACRHAIEHLRLRHQSGDDAYRKRLLGLLEDLTHRPGPHPPVPRKRTPTRFFVKKPKGRMLVVSAEQVLWTEARRDYIRLHTTDGPHLIRDTMTVIEQQLDPRQFVRIHRSTIVRLDEIAEIQTVGDGKLAVVLKDGSRHAVSASGRQRLQDRLGLKG